VPHLKSITDTSYFPTDEIDQSASEAPSGDAADAKKDLAFLGYTWVSGQTVFAVSALLTLTIRFRRYEML